MPAPSRLSMDLRDGRKAAVERVRRALLATDSIAAAARRLGVPRGTLFNWGTRGGAAEIPAVSALLDELELRGKPGRRPNADQG